MKLNEEVQYDPKFELHQLSQHLTASFDYFVEETLPKSIANFQDTWQHGIIRLGRGWGLRVLFDPKSITVGRPRNADGTPLYPNEARLKKKTYCGDVHADLWVELWKQDVVEEGVGEWKLIEKMPVPSFYDKYGTSAMQNNYSYNELRKVLLGKLPIMLMSKHCWLRDENGSCISKEKRLKLGDDLDELGGYFVICGTEKILRLLVQQRANFPVSFSTRSILKKAEGMRSEIVITRSMTSSGFSIPNALYLDDGGGVILNVFKKKQLFVPLPVILLALNPVSMKDLFEYFRNVECGDSSFTVEMVKERAMVNVERIRRLQENVRGTFGAADGRINWVAYLGATLAETGERYKRPHYSHEAHGMAFLHTYILPHLNDDTFDATATAAPAENLRKFSALIQMLHKLLNYCDGITKGDSRDATSNQDIFMPHSIMGTTTYIGLTRVNSYIQMAIEKKMQSIRKETTGAKKVDISTDELLLSRVAQDLFTLTYNKDLLTLTHFEYLLRTGNFPVFNNNSGMLLAVPQPSGMSTIVERTNILRLISQARNTNKGSKIQEMRVSGPRQFPLEAWGFLCPVETPDGAPCGVVNTLALLTKLLVGVNSDQLAKQRQQIINALLSLGMKPLSQVCSFEVRLYAHVTFNGEVLGYVPSHLLLPQYNSTDHGNLTLGQKLRYYKNASSRSKPFEVPDELEIAEIPPNGGGAQCGLHLFNQPGTCIRPVYNRLAEEVQHIGPLEQVYLNIQADKREEESSAPKFTHEEIHPSCILGLCASLIPFFECNPGPRNLFECQMAKNTMALPATNYVSRLDSKVVVLRNLQNPLVRTKMHRKCEVVPLVTNAVVAVVSYSEYDMEDAVIINKSAIERGMFAGDQYKCIVLDLTEEKKEKEPFYKCFKAQPGELEGKPYDGFGLPKVGQMVTQHTKWVSIAKVKTEPARTKLKQEEAPKPPKINVKKEHSGSGDEAESSSSEDESDNENTENTAPQETPMEGTDEKRMKDIEIVEYSEQRYGKTERGYVDDVFIIERCKHGFPTIVVVRVRMSRVPVSGDKFASMHGQKGTLSLQFPQVDLPFTDSGITPDVIINPHAFPSRMTVGMMLELLAGKSAAIKGAFHEPETVSAWHLATKKEGGTYHDAYGKQLVSEGFDYYGEETMYSGETGGELRAHVFLGVCAYQRLRNLVMDKWQVRERSGKVDISTMQPVKGKKRGGGIKVGEMERDAFLAHGSVNVAMDRLYSVGTSAVPVCTSCGIFISLVKRVESLVDKGINRQKRVMQCPACQSEESTFMYVNMPFSFIYLCVELMALNIQVHYKINQKHGEALTTYM